MTLSIRRLTLYKHGISVVERQGEVAGRQTVLTFRREQMNDVLKSLVVYDRAGGRVLNIAYDAPEERQEKLARGSIHLSDDHTLLDLVRDLRGRAVRVHRERDGQPAEITGTIVGLDISDSLPFAQGRLSLLTDRGVEVLRLHDLRGVQLLDDRAQRDLDYFLHTSVAEAEERTVTVRLSEGAHDLVVRYLTPSPTWRVSYRLVGERLEDGARRALLQGWGIFDNPFDEPLEGVQVTLVSGMPISFVYDLYHPFTPERPVVEEESRVAPAAFEMERASRPMAEPQADMAMPAASRREVTGKSGVLSGQAVAGREALAGTTEVDTATAAVDDQFEYRIGHPVTVQRGEAAMVPILSTDISYRKEHIYNGRKLPRHPSVVLRFDNGSGLTLERGPIMVIEDDSYTGEAILPFSRPDAEVLLPVAADLGVSVREKQETSHEIHKVTFERLFLLIHQYTTWEKVYEVSNSNQEPVSLLIEHPRTPSYHLLNMPEPEEQTEEHYRWRIEVPAGPEGHTTFTVRERRLNRRQEQLEDLSGEKLQRYIRNRWVDEALADGLGQLISLYEEGQRLEKQIEQIETERKRLHASQEQARKTLGSLKESGKEGELRGRYVDQLNASEDRLASLDDQQREIQQAQERLEQQVTELIQSLE